MCGVTDHFARGCPHWETLCLAQGAFKLQRARSTKEGTHPKKPPQEGMV